MTVGNPHIVYGISVNKLIYSEQRDDKPDIAQYLKREKFATVSYRHTISAILPTCMSCAVEGDIIGQSDCNCLCPIVRARRLMLLQTEIINILYFLKQIISDSTLAYIPRQDAEINDTTSLSDPVLL